MLGLESIQDLADRIAIPARQIYSVANDLEGFVRHYELYDPSKPSKAPRPVICATGLFRKVQDSLLRKLFLPSIRPSPYNHGGVARRNIRSNALAHANSVFGWKTDLSNFFPSIHRSRVERLFVERMQCNPVVAGILSRLCTFDHHLAMGLPTSPLLADQIATRLDVRIAGMAKKTGLVYTRFVDDITLSGHFSLDELHCHLPQLVGRIIEECGFGMSAGKTHAGRLDGDEFIITALRFHKGRLDVAADYLEKVESQITDHWNLANGNVFQGPFMTREMLRSRIIFISSIRPARRTPLLRRFGSIDWSRAMMQAQTQKLVVERKLLIPVKFPGGARNAVMRTDETDKTKYKQAPLEAAI
jgi:RNA-directed DNA polymerase